MQPTDAPTGFHECIGDRAAMVDGVYITSAVPTRFFQTLDAYPPHWGRLSWRLQLNKVTEDRASSPAFRTFYSGVEWNLRHPDYRWFLSGWFKWLGPGPELRDIGAYEPVQVQEDTVLFHIARTPNESSAIYLRSRVDARERARIAESLRTQAAIEPEPNRPIILLDDLLRPK